MNPEDAKTEFGKCTKCGWGHGEAEYVELCGVAIEAYRNRVRIGGELFCPDCARAKRRLAVEASSPELQSREVK